MSTTTHPVSSAVANVEARRKRHEAAARLGQEMGARRFLADISSGRARFRCPTDLADHVEAISHRLYRTAAERAHFGWGYLKECQVWR